MVAILNKLLLVVAISIEWYCVAIDDVEILLYAEKNLKPNGVRGRLTFHGMRYTIKALTKALLPQFRNITMKSPPLNMTIGNTSIMIEKIRLLTASEPKQVDVNQHQFDNVIISMHNFKISIESTLRGENFSEAFVNGRCTISSKQTRLNIIVRVRKGTNGSPLIDVHECQADITAPYVIACDMLLPVNMSSLVQESLLKEAPHLFGTSLCDHAKWIITSKINERFMRMPSSISLAEIAKADLFSHRKPLRSHNSSIRGRARRTPESLIAFIDSFNLSRANNLLLDYGMLTNPITSPYGVEFNSSGEVSVDGKGGTPFGSVSLELPPALKNSTAMLQMVISDFVPNSLMHHGHKTGLFNTRIDPTTPQLGPVMRTTCGFNSGPLFCLGDLLPTLRHFHPNRGIAMIFSSAQPPAIIFRSGNEGAFFAMNGHIAVWAIDDRGVEKRVGDMAIEIEAFAKFRIAGTILKSKLSLEKIHLKSLNSDALQQDELDDAGLLGREIMQKIVNDVLKDGVPIPIHPIFRLRKTKVAVIDRACILVTDFRLNNEIIKELANR